MTDFDVVVIGSGFGGSTAALRLTEKGYRVAVLEAGRRFDESTYPKTSWRLRSFLWAPRLGCYGMQRISLLKDVMILSGAGVGGGTGGAVPAGAGRVAGGFQMVVLSSSITGSRSVALRSSVRKRTSPGVSASTNTSIFN